MRKHSDNRHRAAKQSAKVSIVAPADTSQFQFGKHHRGSNRPRDWDGHVNHVTLLADGRELAELIVPPFATAWTNATLAGTFFRQWQPMTMETYPFLPTLPSGWWMKTGFPG